MQANEVPFCELGEVVLEEILLRAGLEQPRSANTNRVALSLDFEVCVDKNTESVVIQGNRFDGSPLNIRLNIGSTT